MSDVTIFVIGLAVFGIALMGTMWSIIPADRRTASMSESKILEVDVENA